MTKYEDTIDAYINVKRPVFKEEIIRLKKIRPADYLKELPEDVIDIDPIYIYRSSLSADLSEVRKEISWTTDVDTALLFYWRNIHAGFQNVHLYNGVIEKAEIIAYTNRLNEFEVLQYGSVQSIKEIPVLLSEVESAAFRLLGEERYHLSLKTEQ